MIKYNWSCRHGGFRRSMTMGRKDEFIQREQKKKQNDREKSGRKRAGTEEKQRGSAQSAGNRMWGQGALALVILTVALGIYSCASGNRYYVDVDASEPELDVQLLDVNPYSRPGIESNGINWHCDTLYRQSRQHGAGEPGLF